MSSVSYMLLIFCMTVLCFPVMLHFHPKYLFYLLTWSPADTAEDKMCPILLFSHWPKGKGGKNEIWDFNSQDESRVRLLRGDFQWNADFSLTLRTQIHLIIFQTRRVTTSDYERQERHFTATSTFSLSTNSRKNFLIMISISREACKETTKMQLNKWRRHDFERNGFKRFLKSADSWFTTLTVKGKWVWCWKERVLT